MKFKAFLKIFIKYLLVQIGSILAALALEVFLVPNNLIDGGVVGIAIITNYITKIPLGLLLIILNLPFVFLGFRKLGKEFVITTIYAVLSMSFWVSVLKPLNEVTHDFFLASVFGGIFLGLGVGIIIRNGGSLDGTEITAIIFNNRIGFSVGEIVLFFNFFIFGSAGLVFGWDKAMYSLVTYFVAYRIIDMVVEGLDDAKGIYIISPFSDDIKSTLIKAFNRGITVFKSYGGFSNEPRDVLYIIVRRSEIYKLKKIVHQIDESAFITIQEIHEVIGKNVKYWK